MEKIKENDPRFIGKKNNGYTKAIEISNLRLRLTPHSVFYCEKEQDVIEILQYCKNHKTKFKIRSGGHHHEGACSGNEVIIIDTSRLNKIEINGSILTVGPGAKLEDIYRKLLKDNKIFPGGGCESVAIGGLVQGGGWGPYSRLLGMTCDALIEANIIMATKKTDQARSSLFKATRVTSETHKDLFKAIKGSGGGNFGIITELKFNLHKLIIEDEKPEKLNCLGLKNVKEERFQSNLLTFEIYIEDEQEARKQVENWFNNAHLADPRITSFGRVYPKNNKTRFYIGAKVLHGNPEYLSHYITSLLGDIPSKYRFEYNIQKFETKENQLIGIKEKHKLNKNRSIDYFLLAKDTTISKLDLNAAPGSTCDKPHPHKVSSFFPNKLSKDYEQSVVDKIEKGSKIYYDIKTPELLDSKEIFTENIFAKCFNKDLMLEIFDYMNMDISYLDEKISCYLSLHGMGGAIENGDNSFYYKDRPFMFQIQAWWEDVDTPFEDKYISWVEGLRLKLSNLTEGCFINFPDYNCILNKYHKFYDPNNHSQRQLLLEKFFGKECNKDSLLTYLKEIKKTHDLDNFFNHEMSLINK